MGWLFTALLLALFFFSRGFAEFVIQRARAHDVDPSILVLEITEDILLGNIELTHEVIGTLKSSGVRMSLDDFGKGYSSLHYLNYLPLEELKLDKAFVDYAQGYLFGRPEALLPRFRQPGRGANNRAR